MVEFKRSHDHQRGRTGQPTTIYLPEDLRKAIEARRGRKSFSLCVAELVDMGLRVGDAAMNPILRDARVQHVKYVNQTTKRLHVERTSIQPSQQQADAIGDPGHGMQFSVRHDEELPRSAEVRSGDHFLVPGSCLGCLLTVRDCRLPHGPALDARRTFSA